MPFLSNIFGRANAPAPAPVAAAPAATPAAHAPAPATQGAGPVTKLPGVPNPGAVPGATQPGNSALPEGQVTPLDGMVNLFTRPAPKPGAAPAPAAPTLNDPILPAFDPAILAEQAKNANFVAAINPEVLQRAASGDATALAEAINSASQQAFMMGTQVSAGLVDHGARTAAQRVESGLDGRIRNFQVRAHNPENQVLSHPAVAPVLGALKAQIAASQPNLSAAQVAQQAEQWFLNVGQALNAPAPATEDATASANTKTNFAFLLDNPRT